MWCMFTPIGSTCVCKMSSHPKTFIILQTSEKDKSGGWLKGLDDSDIDGKLSVV